MIELQEIPEPIGSFILAQKDVEHVQTHNGSYWHYKDVCTLLSRLKKEYEGKEWTDADMITVMENTRHCIQHHIPWVSSVALKEYKESKEK